MAKTIMIVDDSATMLLSLRSTLEMNGYKVEAASDGQAAVDRLATGIKPDLIITDINMPRMGGLDLIRHVRGLPAFRFTPILTLTTESQTDIRDQGRRLGATGWLVKPVAGPALIGVIKQVLPGG
ncbi:response regulator [Novosphingobium sp. FKTRR1]|uniref:response regulator n=1 Tax=unclassified Novosphingobium TaxID=2644732 RepID=UPI001CEFEE47|nr:response regulator [Novosphingobium sp. FKTRR1]